jgi:rhodanese-related sulfurtransferase
MSPQDLPGWFNARDLGGLPGAGGRVLRPGALVRSDSPDSLTPESAWRLWALGYRTLVDLRNQDEVPSETPAALRRFHRLHLPHDGEAPEFWEEWGTGPQFGTPLFYGPHLERFPERTRRVLEAIADAPEGGVIVHCSVGRDRTGMVVAVLLRLLGVEVEEVVRDYERSEANLAPLHAARGDPCQGDLIRKYLQERGLTPGACLRAFLGEAGAEHWADRLGLDDRVLEALVERLTHT